MPPDARSRRTAELRAALPPGPAFALAAARPRRGAVACHDAVGTGARVREEGEIAAGWSPLGRMVAEAAGAA